MRAAAIAMALLLGLLALNHAPPERKHQPRKARETHRFSLQRPR